MTSASRIQNSAPVGSLLKRPGEAASKRRNDFGRKPRVEEPKHIDAIKTLPCLKCGLEDCSQAAHVRMNSAAFGKRTGGAEKPDDRFCVPLCAACHLYDPDSQHKVGELTFWNNLGLNPLLIAEQLHKRSPDIVAMRAVVFTFIAQRQR